MSTAVNAGAARPHLNRWLQLFLGIVCMAMIANLQYGWTLFVNPIDAKHHWGRAAIQVAFNHVLGPHRHRVLRVGGDLQPLPLDVRRHHLAAGLNAVAAIMALAVLRPMRMRQMQSDGATPASAARASSTAAA